MLVHQSMCFHPYLHVLIPSHRKSLTQLLLCDHILAEVVLRYSERHCPSIPHHWWLCRFCKNDVENPCHALFACDGSEQLLILRKDFFASIFQVAPEVQRYSSYQHLLGLALRNQVAVEILAKYAHNVLEIYKSKDIYIVAQSVDENDDVWAPLPIEKAINNML